jgi:hypothetical protein
MKEILLGDSILKHKCFNIFFSLQLSISSKSGFPNFPIISIIKIAFSVILFMPYEL